MAYPHGVRIYRIPLYQFMKLLHVCRTQNLWRYRECFACHGDFLFANNAKQVYLAGALALSFKTALLKQIGWHTKSFSTLPFFPDTINWTKGHFFL